MKIAFNIKNQESNQNHDEEDSEFELQPKNEEEKKLFLDLNSKERALIKDTWKSFRGEHDCRLSRDVAWQWH